jgi:hypothetical protein
MNHVIRSLTAIAIAAGCCLAVTTARSRADQDNTTVAPNFTFQAKLIANDGTSESFLGHLVAINGDTAIVSALVNNGNNGLFYVFVRSGNTWTQQAKLIPSDGVAVNFHSVLSAAISGDTVVINGPAATINSNTNQGAAYVFVRNGTTWTEQQRLTASDGAAEDQFGSVVSIDGDSIVVGAVRDDVGSNTNQGSAYVYVRQGAVWTEQAKLVANDGAANGLLGLRVSISGNTVAVTTSNFSSSSVGHAYVFFRSGTNWSQQANFSVCEPHSPNIPCRIANVAVNGDTLIFGDQGVNVGNNTFQGAAYVFIRSGTTWSQQQRLIASDGKTDDSFGSAMIEGNTVVVGARDSAYVFTRSGNVWTEQQKLQISNSYNIAFSGNTILVSTPFETINGNTNQGSVSVFVTPIVGNGIQAEIKSWTIQGRTYAYVKLSFPNAGYSVANWGQALSSTNDFTADATVNQVSGPSVQAVTTTAQIYDLGPLANGTYNFNFKTSGTLAKTLQFTIGSTVPPANPIDDQRQFVRQQYLDFLNREPDTAGWDFWTDNITKCADPNRRPAGQTEAQCTLRQRETTSGAFFLSPEFQYTGYYVYRAYQGALGRQPKLSEFIPDALIVGNGIIVGGQLSAAKINQNKADFAAQFVNCTDATMYRCAEFKAIYDPLNNTQYVDKLFQTTGVNASASDRTALVTGLNNASETRATVLQKVVDGINVISEGNQQFTTMYGKAFYDQQFTRAFVQLEYFGYMKRDPDEAGYAFWLSKLNQYPSFVEAEMVLAFISSPEYRARFGQP